MQGSARKDVVCGAARVYIVVLPGPKWKSWLRLSPENPGRFISRLLYLLDLIEFSPGFESLWRLL